MEADIEKLVGRSCIGEAVERSQTEGQGFQTGNVRLSVCKVEAWPS